MNIIRTLLLFFVAICYAAAREFAANPELAGAPKSTGIPRDSGTAGSLKARLRGSSSAENVLVESDLSGAGGEEGGFCFGAGFPCASNGNCCSKRCKNGSCRKQTSTPPAPTPSCIPGYQPCTSSDECCDSHPRCFDDGQGAECVQGPGLSSAS